MFSYRLTIIVVAAISSLVVAALALATNAHQQATDTLTSQLYAANLAADSASGLLPPTLTPTLTPTGAVLTKHDVATGVQVAGTVGVVFVNADTGTMEVWTAKAPDSTSQLLVSPDGELLLYVHGRDANDYEQYLVVRASGMTYRVASPVSTNLMAASGLRVLTLEPKADSTYQLGILDVDTRTLRPVALTIDGREAFQALPAPDNAVIIRKSSAVYRVDYQSGAVTQLAITIGGSPDTSDAGSLYGLPGDLGFAVASSRGEGDTRWYGWDGHLVADHLPPGMVAPDGKLIAASTQITTIRSGGMGAYLVLSETTVTKVDSGTPVMRVRGGSLAGGWTADSQAFLVQGQHGDTVLLSLDGAALAHFSYPGLFQSGPIPSPRDAALIGTVKGIVNVKTGKAVGPILPVQSLIRTGWTKAGESFSLTFMPMPGKDGGFASELFPPKVEFPPFSDVRVLAVRISGECLDLRDGPGAGSTMLGCYADGATATITEAPDPLYDPSYDKDGLGPQPLGGVLMDDGSVWLHVQMADGKAGWMDSEHLGWS